MVYTQLISHAVLYFVSLTLLAVGQGAAISHACGPLSRACQHEVSASRESVLLQTSSWHFSDSTSRASQETHQKGPTYRLNLAGTCQDYGMLTIDSLDECLRAAASLTRNADIAFPSDQPAGGYQTAGDTTPGGCAMHLLEWAKQGRERHLHFYRDSNGACGANMFLCFCREPSPTLAPTPTSQPTAAPTTPPLPTCKTCRLGDLCFQDVAWTMVHGLQVQPDWYNSGDIDESSCFEDVQMFLYQRQQKDRSYWDGMLVHPIPAPCWREQSLNYMSGELLYCR